MHDKPFQSPTNSEFQPPKPAWRVSWWGTTLFVVGVLAVLAALILPEIKPVRPEAYRNICRNNLRQIGFALENYAERNGSYPPAYTVDATGKPLHSWRTLILPYLEEAALYKSIDLTKPWDDPVNAQALHTHVLAFQCAEAELPPNHTSYLAIVTPQSCLRGGKSVTPAEVTDGLSKTITVIEVPNEKSVPWMSPQDADESLFAELLRNPKPKATPGQNATWPHRGQITHVVYADSRVEAIKPEDKSLKERRALITIAGGD